MTDLAQGASGTWYYIYRSADGVHVSETGDLPDSAALAASGLAVATFDHRPDPNQEGWDPVAKALTARAVAGQTWQAPPVSSSYKFVGYAVLDSPGGFGVEFDFFGPLADGKLGNVNVVCTDSELSGISTQSALVTLVTQKLQRKLRAVNIASKLDPLIGQSVTI